MIDEPSLSQDVLEAVPVDEILNLMNKAIDQGMKEWIKIVELEARVADLETQCKTWTEIHDWIMDHENRVALLEEAMDTIEYQAQDPELPHPKELD